VLGDCFLSRSRIDRKGLECFVRRASLPVRVWKSIRKIGARKCEEVFAFFLQPTPVFYSRSHCSKSLCVAPHNLGILPQAKVLGNSAKGLAESRFRRVVGYSIQQTDFPPRKSLEATIKHISSYGITPCKKFVNQNLQLKTRAWVG
jgi:hypothetical protein